MKLQNVLLLSAIGAAVVLMCCIASASASPKQSSSSTSSATSSRRSKSRSRVRQQDHNTCHLKEIDSCLDKVQALAKGPNPSAIITTSDGLDKLCSTVKDILKCAKAFLKKCGTPLQRELYELTIEYFSRTMHKFCDEGSTARKVFLESSPCIHDKVLSRAAFKTSCNSAFIASLDHAVNRTEDMDSRVETVCCGHNTWQDCTSDMIRSECGEQPMERFENFAHKTLGGGLVSMICPRTVFPPTGKVCKLALPPVVKGSGTKTKTNLADNFIGKYLHTYLSFIFNHA